MKITVNNETVWTSDDRPEGTGSLVLNVFDQSGRQLAYVKLNIRLCNVINLMLPQLTDDSLLQLTKMRKLDI